MKTTPKQKKQRKKVRRTAAGQKKRRTKSAVVRRMETLSAQDIGALPDVVNPQRRQAGEASLRVFCEIYLPTAFYLPWSSDHLIVLDTMQKCVEKGGMFAFAMPRGNGKSTISRAAALWAVLTGRAAYVCLIGGSRSRALEILVAIKTLVLSPEMKDLRDDFPEALYPLWRLEDSPRRAAGQHINGEKTNCIWAVDRIVFPWVVQDTLPGYLQDLGLSESPACSAVISATSLDSHLRGQFHSRHDGGISRPDFVLLDDPQTRESAKSPTQTAFRVDLINGDVLGLAGPDKRPSILLACTVIYENDLADQILDPERNPQWQGVRMRMVNGFPTNEQRWDEYRRIREHSYRVGKRGVDANPFYLSHQVELEEGSEMAWAERKNPDDVSALQYAMNLQFDMGDDAFQSEFQNKPKAAQEMGEDFAKPPVIMSRINGRERGSVPVECDKITAFIDLQKQIHYWGVMGWRPDMSGCVLDYGTYPDQKRHYFTSSDAPKKMSALYPGAGEDGVIQSGLEDLIKRLLSRKWKCGEGARKIDRMLIDKGYKSHIVDAVKRKFSMVGELIWPSKGIGIRAGMKPVSMFKKQRGWKIGFHWFVPSVLRVAEFRHVATDVNYWKSAVHSAFLATPGDPGSVTIFGNEPTDHSLFANHIGASETFTVTFGHGRQVHEWKERPEKPDNHYFDVVVGCFAGAAMLGVFGDAVQSRPRRKFTQADLKRKGEA